MITEAEFQAALDASPDDHTTRLVFADWLEEQGDARYEGYRALGVNGRVPVRGGRNNSFYFPGCGYEWSGGKSPPGTPKTWLPKSWARLVSWSEFDSRRGAEDAAALAFARLPSERRAELLGIVKVGS